MNIDKLKRMNGMDKVKIFNAEIITPYRVIHKGTISMRAAGMPEGEYILGSLKDGQKVIVEGGVAKLMDRSAFAGSVATADRLIRTMVKTADVPLIMAVKMMTITPASIIGVNGRKGSLMQGKDADIIIFDEDIRIKLSMIQGKIIYNE